MHGLRKLGRECSTYEEAKNLLDHRSQSLQPVASLSLDKDPGQGKPAEIVETGLGGHRS
jgi:hypothetical protein